jgi:hypothetical protein
VRRKAVEMERRKRGKVDDNLNLMILATPVAKRGIGALHV